jgi:beta-lactam-binding protein with PASTA domain
MGGRIMVAAVATVALASVASAASAGGSGSSRLTAAAATVRRVPNEVGKNHQAAQNHLQSKGFFNLRERDCTGRGRLLLFDRNWKVVRQTPPAGTRISTKRRITLCSVKYSD